MPREQITKYLKEISANKDKIQKVRDLNFDKELQVKYETNRIKARKDKELERIILTNKHFGRPDRDGQKEITDELDELIREKANELKNMLATDNDLIASLLKT